VQRIECVKKLLEYKFPLLKAPLKGKVPYGTGWQNQKNGNFTTSDLDHIDHLNVCVLMGQPLADGRFLFCVDIDPRNGGDLDQLQFEYNLPETLTVKTGGGGYHLFYASEDKPVRKTVLKNGVDIIGIGGQVVGAGSMHSSGKIYEMHSDLGYIETAPQNLLDSIEKASKKEKLDFVETEKITSNRNLFLTSQAGKLTALRLSEDQLLDMLIKIDLDRCDPPLHLDPKEKPDGMSQLKRIAKQAQNWIPSDNVSTEVWLEAQQIERFDPTKFFKDDVPETPIVKPHRDFNYEAEFAKIIPMLDGITRNLAEQCINSAQRQYPQFAIASAFGIVSAVTQGSFKPKLVGTDVTKGMLSLYQMCIAPAASGKDHYLNFTDAYIKSVDRRFLASEFGSVQGMVDSFWLFNSRVSVIDEVQDYFEKLSNANNVHLNQIFTLTKKLFNDLDELPNVQTKGKAATVIRSPKYSIFAAGTKKGFVDNLKDKNVSGGLQSRMLVWPEPSDIREINRSMKSAEVDQTIVECLKEIARFGIAAGYSLDPYEQETLMSRARDGRSKLTKEEIELIRNHEPALDPKHSISFNREAEQLLIDYQDANSKRFSEIHRDEGMPDGLGSIIDRSSYSAIKLACIHAIGRGTRICERKDAQIGISIMDLLTKHIVDIVNELSRNDGEELKIIRFIERKPMCGVRDIDRGLNLRSKDLHQILIRCWLEGKIKAHKIDREILATKNLVDERLSTKIARGVRFSV
jgi:hypothetical protein